MPAVERHITQGAHKPATSGTGGYSLFSAGENSIRLLYSFAVFQRNGLLRGSCPVNGRKTCALSRLLQEGQAVSEPVLIPLLRLKVKCILYNQAQMSPFHCQLLCADHPCLTDTIVQRAPLVIKCRHDVTN